MLVRNAIELFDANGKLPQNPALEESALNKNLMDEVCLSLSKSGSLNGYTDNSAALARFADTGTDAQILTFYDHLRDNSERCESEWREEFQALFPKVVDHLPSLSDESQWGEKLHAFVDKGDLVGVKSFIEEIGILTWSLDQDWEGFDVYPIEHEDEHCERPIQKAKRLGHSDLAEYLTDVLNRFKISR